MIIEAMTYRLSGHSTSDDPKAYRKEGEVEQWKLRDPLARVKKHLVSKGAWDDDKQRALEARVEGAIKDAVAVAEKIPAPALETMFEDVFAELPWHLREQQQALLGGPRAKGH
jgi:2-oxoisovalerate dehydrogenase E1 component alpha subunit